MPKRKRRVPEVLRRAYGDGALTLEATVLSLLPSPPPFPAECRCKGRRCFGCVGKPFLLRPDDGPEYRRLLTRGFCVVSPDAPKLADIYFDNDWSQRMIVMNTMEWVIDNSKAVINVLCHGYNTQSRFSPNGEFLCTPAWTLLLNRIGDPVMIFLLKFTSIFVPLSNKNHYQVTGPPLNKIIQSTEFECNSKRRQIDSDDLPKKNAFSLPAIRSYVNYASGSPNPSLGGMANSYEHSKVNRQKDIVKANETENRIEHTSDNNRSDSFFLRHISMSMNHHMGQDTDSPRLTWKSAVEGKKFYSAFVDSLQRNSTEAETEDVCSVQQSNEVISESRNIVEVPLVYDSPKDNSADEFGSKTRKRRRLYRWQRLKRYRKMRSFEENSSRNYPFIRGDVESSCSDPQERSVPNYSCKYADQASECYYCLMLKALPKVVCETQINRQHMFYSSLTSCSVFPRSHILNRLKPNAIGAVSLMKNVLGISEGLLSTHILPCFDSSGSCLQPNCLYHSLLKLLKDLIRNARRCQFLKLLHKHCTVSTSGRYPKCKRGAMSDVICSQGSEKKVSSSEKQIARLESSVNLLEESSLCYGKKAEQIYGKSSKFYGPEFQPNESFCEHKQVVSFIWAVCRSIVPLDLLGDSSTWRALRKNISKFVRLRRFEKFSLKQCIQGLKTSRISFLSRDMRYSSCFCSPTTKDACCKGEPEKLRKSQISMKDKFFRSLIYWFFSYMVVPIIGANFYVTEREGGKQDVFYYPKPVWRKLVNQAIMSLKEQRYRKINSSHFRSIVTGRSFGFSKVRFLPKEKGIRPLANLKAPSKACFAKFSTGEVHQQKVKAYSNAEVVHFRSVNSALCDLDAILKRVKSEGSEFLGSSVFDYNDVYRALHPFISGLRNDSMPMPKVFIIVCDVSKAFDSIDHDRLLDIIKDILDKDVYHFRRYAQVICTKKSLGALYRPVSFDENGNRDVARFAASIRFCSCHGVLVDQGAHRNKKKEELHHLLHEHVKANVVQLGNAFYLQQIGISQGSSLSSLLCSFYYGHMEKNMIIPFLQKNHKRYYCNFDGSCELGLRFHCASKVHSAAKAGSTFPYLEPAKDELKCLSSAKSFYLENGRKDILDRNKKLPNDDARRVCGNIIECDESSSKHVLLRLIDDFLFITTSEKLATSFFSRLRRGFREYNCFMNNDKFGMNFDLGNQSRPLHNRVYTGADGVSFLPWTGILVNCQTLEIQADYTRYWDVHMSSTLTIRIDDKPGNHLKAKLYDYMRPKCHPLFYDSNINSPAIVRLNAYQAFLICAMKFHCYVCVLTDILSPEYCADIIQRSFSYMYKLIKKRMYDTENYGNICPLLRLKKVEILWLGLSAYIRVLKKKQSRHLELLSILSSKLNIFPRMDCSSHLKYAVDDSHSSLLWKIKY